MQAFSRMLVIYIQDCLFDLFRRRLIMWSLGFPYESDANLNSVLYLFYSLFFPNVLVFLPFLLNIYSF